MSEDEEILQGLDLLGDWLDAKGYTEEAGLCTRAMDKINLLKSIASKAIREQRDVMLEERERCYMAAVSTTCSVEETADYYSGYCDGVQDAAAALKETGDE